MKTYKKPFSRVINLGTRKMFLGDTFSITTEQGGDELSKEHGGSSMWENMDED